MKNFLVGLGLWLVQTFGMVGITCSVMRVARSRSWAAAGEGLLMILIVGMLCALFHTIGERFRR